MSDNGIEFDIGLGNETTGHSGPSGLDVWGFSLRTSTTKWWQT